MIAFDHAVLVTCNRMMLALAVIKSLKSFCDGQTQLDEGTYTQPCRRFSLCCVAAGKCDAPAHAFIKVLNRRKTIIGFHPNALCGRDKAAAK